MLVLCVYTDAAPFSLSLLLSWSYISFSFLFSFSSFPSFLPFHYLSLLWLQSLSSLIISLYSCRHNTGTSTNSHIQPTNSLVLPKSNMNNTTTRKEPISTPLLQSNDKRHSQPRGGLKRQSHILQSRRASSTGTSTGTPTQHYCYACDQPCTHSDRKHINALGRLYHYQCFVCEASI